MQTARANRTRAAALIACKEVFLGLAIPRTYADWALTYSKDAIEDTDSWGFGNLHSTGALRCF